VRKLIYKIENLKFESWFAQLKYLSWKKGVQDVINYTDIESYREGYNEGNSPEDELDEQLSYCDRRWC
jgi:hypothetical protein